MSATSTLSPAGAARTSAAPHLRLTRRGRAVLVLLLVVVLFAAFSLGRTATQAAPVAGGGAPALTQTVVEPGESLWSVARRIAPDNDPRDVVAQIRSLNDLTSSELQPGQQLLLPVAV